jgi:DHA1 family bicyclomycin/chloramphenicol resistance-like MFS transporter
MTPNKNQSGPSYIEFVILVSMMMSLMALSIDAMLPALPQIGSDLNVQNANSRQLVVSSIFLGAAVGQLFFGPLSDKTGRKPAIYIGYSLYIFGSMVSAFAYTFPMMLSGRLIQGIGISAPRAVLLALVRDLYKGRLMAQVMSFVMTVLLLIPMLAPSLGQAILLQAGWRSIFISLVSMALITLIWFALRMPETLSPEKRTSFSLGRIINSLGLASFLNASLVLRFGMRFLVRWSLIAILGLSAITLGITFFGSGVLYLWLIIAYLMSTFFCVGILNGNQNSLAMEPLGNLAGIGAAVVGSFSTLLSIPLGILIGQSYNGTTVPLIIGVAVLSGISLGVVLWTETYSTKVIQRL